MGLLRDTQLGFRKGNRTSDAHIILHTLIQKYCFHKNQRLYACFVDFKKAFDTIPRDILFQKLLNHGIKGKFFNVLKAIYMNDSVCIKVGDKVTDPFQVNQGVKQGCVLSPLLFNIFLADLPDILLSAECQPAKLTNSKILGCLAWADDLLLLSESNKGLQCMLSKLCDYSSSNYLEINCKKTEAMIFNKTGKFFRSAYKLKKSFIYTTNAYKYLGFLITPSGALTHGLSDLKDRALRAYYKLKRKLENTFRKDVNTTIFLFNALIKPILLYASDFWGCLKMPKNNPIENVHMRFCKDLLGVQKQTTNVGVLLELGEVPFGILAKNNCIKNYSRISISKQANTLLTALAEPGNEAVWFAAANNSLNRIGIEKTDNLIRTQLLKRMKDIFHQESLLVIKSENSKLRTYGEMKTKPGVEPYLLHPMKIEQRIAFTKFRLSNHTLMIEKGRHLKLDKNRRFCPFCPSLIETEHHFLLHCKTYTHGREALFLEASLIFPFFKLLTENEKFITITSSEILAWHAVHLTHSALEIRTFLIEEHKNNE